MPNGSGIQRKEVKHQLPLGASVFLLWKEHIPLNRLKGTEQCVALAEGK